MSLLTDKVEAARLRNQVLRARVRNRQLKEEIAKREGRTPPEAILPRYNPFPEVDPLEGIPPAPSAAAQQGVLQPEVPAPPVTGSQYLEMGQRAPVSAQDRSMLNTYGLSMPQEAAGRMIQANELTRPEYQAQPAPEAPEAPIPPREDISLSPEERGEEHLRKLGKMVKEKYMLNT